MSIKNKTAFISILLGLIIVFTAACRFTGEPRIPPGMSRITIPPFENRTNEPGIDGLLMDEVLDQFIAHSQLRLVDRTRANAILEGRIDSYGKFPLIFGDQDIVEQYRLRIEITLQLKDAQTEEILHRFDQIYRETTYSDVLRPRETEFEAQRRVLRQLARDILSSTVHGWPYIEN